MSLYDAVIRHAAERPESLAVAGPGGSLTYGELDRLASAWAATLASMGVVKGDRVLLQVTKSARAVAMMQAVLRGGAMYVPVDPRSPQTRIERIAADCSPSLVVTDELLKQFPESSPLAEPVAVNANDPAYILYTSGSTGEPKGVCLSHGNAEAFIDWAVSTFELSASDRFANHASFHFDLSVLDLYGAFAAGASVHLIPETASFAARELNAFLTGQGITIWYSVPSVLRLMLADPAFPVETAKTAKTMLRVLLFAGESFPIRPLRQLREAWSGVRFWNLYGPTETNVCTAYEVTEIEDQRTLPVPIGSACSGDRVWAETADGKEAAPGEEGQLMVDGPTVMLGYWGRGLSSPKPYATGDWVLRLDEGNYQFLGRTDHLVKLRGYRVELGAIESVLALHACVDGAAVRVEGEGLDAKLVAYVASENCPTLLELKAHCARHLPAYMVVDRVRTMPKLPLNSNGKVDRQTFAAMALT